MHHRFRKSVNSWRSKDTFERFESVNDIIIKRLEKDKELYHPLRKIVSDVISTIEVCEMITAHVAGESTYRPPSAETENAVNLYFEDCFKAHSSKFTKHKRARRNCKRKKKFIRKKCYYNWDNIMVYAEKEPWIQKRSQTDKDLEEKDKIASFEWFCEGARQVHPMNDVKATLPLRLINKMWDSIPEEQSRSKKKYLR